MERPGILKGVNKNEPYPLLYMDTLEHLPTREAKQLEREVLREDEVPNQSKLSSYLTTYCMVVGTDEIMLKTDNNCPNVGAPESYSAHKEKISEHLSREGQREFHGGSSGNEEKCEEDGDLEDASLEPLSIGSAHTKLP